MDISKLIRDPDKIKTCLVELPDGRLVTKKELKIYIPVRFEERDLARVGIDTRILGIYAIVLEDKYYGVSIVNAMVNIAPTSNMKVMFNDEPYYEFTFEPGSTVITNMNLVKTDTLVYKIYDEFISKGRIPWYIGYKELGRLFETAQKYAGANVGQNPEVMEIMVSLISRDPENRSKYYRQTIKSLDEIDHKPPVFIALRNVSYSATNTVNKLAGSYFGTGLTSALVEQTTRTERIEQVLRR